MLFPSGKPLFEDVSSKEYITRSNELRDKALDGCIRILYPDFEEIILFIEGHAVSAIHHSKRWLTVGDEFLEPAENKALAADGRMTAYELSRRLLEVFVHKQVKSMVETELGPYMTAGRLVRHLEEDKSTCVLKLEEGSATAYVFINVGKSAGAAFESPEGRLYDDGAMKAMERFKEHAYVAIYFTEFTQKYLKSKAGAQAEAQAIQKPAAPRPAEPAAPAAPVTPIRPPEPISPFPVEAARPPAKAAPAQPKATVKPKAAGVKLVVALSEDRQIGLEHRSRQQTLEAFEEGDIAWVDGKTMEKLRLTGPDASIILPDGRRHAVRLREVRIKPEESRYIIMSRKLRKRLSVDAGSMIEVTA